MPERLGRRDAIALIFGGLTSVGMPLWLSAAAGAIGLPNNDDWVYTRAAESLFLTGHIDMPGHFAASIGQLLMVQPLLWLSGGDHWAFTAYGLLMTLIAVTSTYLLARRFVGVASALLVVLLLEAFPGMARESATFMTDVPAYAFSAACLFLGIRWLQGDGGRKTLLGSVLAGLLAVSIREFAIAAPIAVLVAGWARNRAEERGLLAVASVVIVAGIGWTLLASASIPGRAVPTTVHLGEVPFVGSDFATLAAVLLPVIALAIGHRMATLRVEHVVLAAAVVLILLLPKGSFAGDLWLANGLGGDFFLAGNRSAVIGTELWALSGQVAAFAAILLATLAIRWAQGAVTGVRSPTGLVSRALMLARRGEAPLLLFLFAYAAELAILSPIVYPYDRYLYPMVAPAAILMLRGSAHSGNLGRRYAASHAALAWLIASAFVIAANSFAYDAARWHSGEAAVAKGYDPQMVDAGYEWVGYHDQSGDPKQASNVSVLTWYDASLSVNPCVVISNTPLDVDRFQLIDVDLAAYRQYLLLGAEQPLYSYGSVTSGCNALGMSER